MNRILVEASELSKNRVVLNDHRARHIREVLRAGPGQFLRAGVVDGVLAEATVVEVEPDRVVLELRETGTTARPDLDLLLAMPRPKVLRRLLPQLSAIGVDRLILCGAERVERFYFDSHVLEPDRLRTLLIEGCVQCGVPAVPRVRIERRFRSALRAACEAEGDRVVLHPGTAAPLPDLPVRQPRAVLAVGPEGGWIPSELERMMAEGFQPGGLGERIYRSDTACVLAVGLMALRRKGGADGGT